MRRALLSAMLAVAGLSATAGAASAATIRADVSIQGAGKVTAPQPLDCHSEDQSSSVVTRCEPQYVEVDDGAVFGFSTTLLATPSATPEGHWTFVRWEGCESTPAPRLCTISAPGLGSRNWRPRAVFRDSKAPTIKSGPDATYSTTEERTVSFDFRYDEGVDAECRIDGGPFSPCSTGDPFTLSEGDHTFDVHAFDKSGNPSGDSTRAVKIVDTAITGGPAEDSLTNIRSATLTASSVAGNAFECRLDSESFGACKTYTALADGRHTFEVRARNGGFVDPIPARRSWRVDGTAPVVGLLANPATPAEGVLSTLNTAAFSFGANEPSAFQCSLDSSAFSACDAPKSYGGLSAGAHRFRVRAIDAASNVGAPIERNWSIAADDLDADGYNARADCNDRDANINPGRPEVVNDDADENCDGVREYDRDHDGSRADKDCDDADPARTPGRAEIPGNGVDEDCDGHDALDTMSITLGSSWKVFKAYTVLTRLTLNGAPLGSKAVVTCQGSKCPKRRVSLTTTKSKQPLAAFVGKRLRAGTVITVRVSRAGFVTAAKRIAIRASKPPVVSVPR